MCPWLGSYFQLISEQKKLLNWHRVLSSCSRTPMLSSMLQSRAMALGRSSLWWRMVFSFRHLRVVCSRISTPVDATAWGHHFYRHFRLEIKLKCFVFPDNGFVLYIQEGSTWTSNCTNYKCAKTAAGAVVLGSSVACPPFNDTECTKVCTLGKVSDNNCSGIWLILHNTCKLHALSLN